MFRCFLLSFCFYKFLFKNLALQRISLSFVSTVMLYCLCSQVAYFSGWFSKLSKPTGSGPGAGIRKTVTPFVETSMYQQSK